MKLSTNNFAGTNKILSGGVHGGGWTTSIRIADDGWMVCRNDTDTGGIRGPNDTKWTQLHRWGQNVPIGDYRFRGLPSHIYDVDICKSDSTRIVMASKGRLYKSDDRGATFAKLTSFKSGNVDTTLTFRPYGDGYDHDARIGGNQVAIDPVNKDRFAVGHPIDGGYITLDGGTTLTRPASLPTPAHTAGVMRQGVHWAFDRSTASGGSTQTVYCFTPGASDCVRRSTTGLGGTFSVITGGPTVCSSMVAGGGKLFVVGPGGNGDSQLFIWNGTAWSQPTSSGNAVTGIALAMHPTDANKIICMRIGGGQWYSSDAGATWTLYDNDTNKAGPGGECPWLAVTGFSSVTTGAIAWDVRSGVNRLVLACGIGIFYLDNPPLIDVAQKYVDRSMGIKQLLMKGATFTPKGTLFIIGEDRPIWRFERGKQTVEATGHGPNYNFAIRHGGDIDFAPEDENYVVATYTEGGGPTTPSYAVSTDNGRNWIEPNNAPSHTRADGLDLKMQGGNIAVTGVNKFVWVSTSGGGIRRYDNGAWTTPVFRDESNNILDMSRAVWHWAYPYRRDCLVSDKANPGTAYLYFNGIGLKAQAETELDYTSLLPLAGLYKTTDHGANWVRIKSGVFLSQTTDFYHGKLRLVPNNPNHMFWAVGPNDADPVSNDSGLYFSNNGGTSFTVLSTFREVEDIAFTQRLTNRTYPRLWVKGHRDVSGTLTNGVWYSDDFNPASPNGATWTLLTSGPEGRLEGNVTLAGDMGSYPGLTIIQASGGFYVDEYSSTTQDQPYKIRAT